MAFNSSVVMRGYLGTAPKGFGNGVSGASFRLASARGFYDRTTQQWRESPTLWITVRAFRGLAQNIVSSLHKGDPVVVVGDLLSDEWTGSDGSPRSALVLQASAVGHDLNQGVSSFAKLRPPASDNARQAPRGSEAQRQAVVEAAQEFPTFSEGERAAMPAVSTTGTEVNDTGQSTAVNPAMTTATAQEENNETDNMDGFEEELADTKEVAMV
jgi:single-strand DNA-binding protein